MRNFNISLVLLIIAPNSARVRHLVPSNSASTGLFACPLRLTRPLTVHNRTILAIAVYQHHLRNIVLTNLSRNRSAHLLLLPANQRLTSVAVRNRFQTCCLLLLWSNMNQTDFATNPEKLLVPTVVQGLTGASCGIQLK